MKSFLFLAALIGLTSLSSAAAQSAQRILTAGGAVTETVFALGQGARIIATDASSLYPPAAVARLPRVGYVRQLTAEGIVSLGPDLVLTTEDAGPPVALEQIRAAGTRVVKVPGGSGWVQAETRIRFIAALVDAVPAGELLVSRLEEARNRVEARQNARKNRQPPRVLFVYARGAGTLMVSGRGTEADTMIALAGGTNAVTGYEGYRPLTPEALAAAAPDLLLFTTLGLESLGGRAGLAGLAAFADGVTLDRAQVASMDDLLLLGFGPRLGEAVEALEALLPPAR